MTPNCSQTFSSGSEVGALLGAARGVVLRIEIEDELAAAGAGEDERAAVAGGREAEVGNRLA
jgi:hypothetical protein